MRFMNFSQFEDNKPFEARDVAGKPTVASSHVPEAQRHPIFSALFRDGAGQSLREAVSCIHVATAGVQARSGMARSAH
jgi:hypothetical protein